MKNINIFLVLLFILSINAENIIQINLNLTQKSTSDYSVDENTIKLIKKGGKYQLKGISADKNIIISASSKVYLNSLTLNSTSTNLTPIIINENCSVTLVLSGKSYLEDSFDNENEGVIFMKKGASLTITGPGILNIYPNKYMAINGSDLTYLTINNGTLNITSESPSSGGIYVRKGIKFNGGNFIYDSQSGMHHAFYSEGSIIIKKGYLNIRSGGKSILARENLYIGQKNVDDSLLSIKIETTNKGIQAKSIEIYSGIIKVDAIKYGIACDNGIFYTHCGGKCDSFIKIDGGDLFVNSEEDGIISNGDIFINGGKILIFGASSGCSQPIDQNGDLLISNSTVFAGGSYGIRGIKAQTTQNFKIYNKTLEEGINLHVYDDDNNDELWNLTLPKEISYIYFTTTSKEFSVFNNDTDIEEPDTVENDTESEDRRLNDHNSGYYLKISFIFFSFLLL